MVRESSRLFCQRGGALEGLVGPCEAGVHTAQAQGPGQGETAGEGLCNSVSCIGGKAEHAPCGVCVAFLSLLSAGKWVVPGAEFCRILHKTLSKSEAYSAASLPAGPEVHCFTRLL